MKADREKIENALQEMVRQLRSLGAKRILLFGSLARGEIRIASDLDLIALFDDNLNFKERMKFVYNNIEPPVDVDILAYSFKEFERLKDRPFFRHILSYAKVVYDE